MALNAEQKKVLARFENLYRSFGLTESPNATSEQRKWHDPPPGTLQLDFRAWLETAGVPYDTWKHWNDRPLGGCHFTMAEARDIYVHSNLLKRWMVWSDRFGTWKVDPRMAFPGERRLCPLWSAWSKASQGVDQPSPPPPPVDPPKPPEPPPPPPPKPPEPPAPPPPPPPGQSTVEQRVRELEAMARQTVDGSLLTSIVDNAVASGLFDAVAGAAVRLYRKVMEVTP